MVVEAAVVAAPLHPVIVMQDVEVTVVDETTETTCVQEGNAELAHEDVEVAAEDVDVMVEAEVSLSVV